ncbi:MAG: hypothetical protein Kow00121_63210 [Elainellaceae cyanobacterium]
MPIALPKIFNRVAQNVPLRWVLTVPFVLPTIGAVVLVGYLSYRDEQTAVANLGQQLVVATNKQVTQELKTYLQTPLLINQLNVDAVNQKQVDLQNIPALESMLFNRLQQFDQVAAVLFASPQGVFRLVDRLPELYLVAADPPRPDQISVYQLDSEGKRGQLVTTQDGLDVRSDRPWYQRAVTTGQVGWNPISQYGSLELLTLDASQPVYDRATGQLLGVFAVHIRLDYLSQFLHELDISRSGRVIIVDQNGALIATSTQEPTYQFGDGTGYNRSFRQLKIDESQDELTRMLGAYWRDHSDSLTSLDQIQFSDFRYQGEPQFVKVTPFEEPNGLNWQVVTVVPQSYFLGAIQDNTHRTLLLSLLTLTTAIGLGLLAANLLIKRFAQLNQVSRDLAAGNLDQRLPTDTPIYELNGLAQTFNQMADQLQQSFDRINTALAESEEKFTTVFRNSPDPIAIASLAEGRILEVNDSLIEFFGYSRLEMIGRTALELNFWSNLDQRNQYRTLLKEQRSIRNLEIQLRTKSGEVKTVLLSAEVRTLEGQDCVIVVHRDISDRKAAEVALRRYERIVSATTDAISLVDRQYRYQVVNQTYLHWNQKSFDEIIGHSVSDLVGQEVFETVIRPRLDRCLAGETIQYHEWFEFPDLGRQFLSVTYSPYTEIDEIDQTISGIVVSVRNITRLKQAEEALRQSEERFREIAQTINQVFFVLSATTGQYLYISPAYEKLWGRSCESLYQNPHSWLDQVHPQDREGVLRVINHSSSSSQVRFEYRIIRSEGEVRWIASEFLTIHDEDGNLLRIVGLAEDITDRKQAEVALRESEERFQEIAQTLNQVSYVVSVPTGQYLYISPAYEKLWGYSCESLYEDPKSWLSQIHPEDLEYVLWGFNRLLSGDSVRLEYRIFCASGEVRWVESESLVVHDENGNPLRVVGLADDITERKLLEQSLRSQAEEEHLLATITQNIRQSLELEQILATTVIEVQRTLKADRALIFRLNQDHSGQVIQEAVASKYLVTDQMRWEDEHFPAECYDYYRQGTPRIVPNVATDEWAVCIAEFMQAMNVKSKVVAPIIQGCSQSSTKVWGLLIVHACSHYRQWQQSEANLLQQISNQLAIAIDQSNLYQQLQTELAERKQAEKNLQEREAMLRAIGDNLPKGFVYQRVYEPGKGFYYSYVSAGVERLLGIKPEEVLKNPQITRSVGFDEDLAIADQLAQESLKNLSPIEIQMRHRSASGEVQWSSIRSVPRRLGDGRTVWDGIEVDITDLKQTEAALRASEELFRGAFDNAPIGISIVSTTGQFIKVNPRYRDLLEYTEAELLGLNFQQISHPADLELDLAGFRRMMAGEINSFQIEKRYLAKSGTVIPVLVHAALIRDQNGQPLYCVGQVQDMRDRLKVERMKNEFISVVSHELRTPLTSIRGALGILGAGVFNDRPEKAQHMLQIAINNSDRLVRLINDILSLERLESGKVQLVMERCQVADLMQQAVDSVQTIADQAAITLAVTPLSAILWAAPDAMIQTFTNLLSNAIKFSDTGDTVWLKAEIRNYGDQEQTTALSPSFPLVSSSYILFTVQDQGRGIPDDKLELIFEQFQQVDVSDSRKKGGTGLGLTICRKIVQQHGGQIWVESKLGVGSTFYIALPLIMKDEND